MARIATKVRQAFPKFEEDFDEIEDEIHNWERRLGAARKSVARGEERANERRQNNVEFLIAISSAGLAIRVRRIAEAVVALINKDNAHAAPAVARALFETCCMPIYLQRELVPRVRKGKVKQSHEIVFRSTLGSKGMFGQDHIRPINVDALIRSARLELREMADQLDAKAQFDPAELIDNYYGPLNEFTHPNWAALTLGVEVGLPPTFDPQVGFDGTTMHSVASSSAYIMVVGGRALDTVLATLAEFPMDLPNGDPLERDAL